MQNNSEGGILLTGASHSAAHRRARQALDERDTGGSMAVVIPLDKAAYEARYREKTDPPMRGLLIGLLAGAYVWMVLAGIVALVAM